MECLNAAPLWDIAMGALVSLLSHGKSDEAGKSEWNIAQLDDVLVGTGRRRERRYGM
jgi:hypothetical protein